MEPTDLEEVRTDVLAGGFVVAGRYVIQHLLGTGGMGSVYLAHDKILGEEKIAIKILHRQFAFEPKYTQRFLREVQLMRRVNHQNVVRTYDVGADGDLVYFTMEYVHGQSVLDLMEVKAFPQTQLIHVTLQICDGLAAIHEANIIHRDLKPGNIILLEDGTTKITDFGVARPESSELTAHNEVIGSSPYIAPEVWLGDKISHAVDLYALGIIFYELVTGVLPFDGDSPAILMRMHLDRSPVPPRELNKTVPSWLNKLILKLLEKTPQARPKSASEVKEYILHHVNPELDRAFCGELHTESASTVSSNTFISKLEELSKKATASSGKQKAYKLQKRIPTWNIRFASRTHVVSRVMDHLTHLRFLATFQMVMGTVLQFSLRRVASLLLVGAVLGGILWGLSSCLHFLSPLDSGVPHPANYYYANSDQSGWLNVVKVGVPYTIFLLVVLSVPPMFIGALCISFLTCAQAFLLSFSFHLVAGIIVFGTYIFPSITQERFGPESVISAGRVTGQVLAEISLLSPVISRMDAMLLGKAVFYGNSTAVSLPDSIVASISIIAYLLLLIYLSRAALEAEARKPELVYVFLVVGLIALLFLEINHISGLSAATLQSTISLQLLDFDITFYKFGLYGSLLNWGFIYCTVGIFIPIVGGTRDKNDYS